MHFIRIVFRLCHLLNYILDQIYWNFFINLWKMIWKLHIWEKWFTIVHMDVIVDKVRRRKGERKKGKEHIVMIFCHFIVCISVMDDIYVKWAKIKNNNKLYHFLFFCIFVSLKTMYTSRVNRTGSKISHNNFT